MQTIPQLSIRHVFSHTVSRFLHFSSLYRFPFRFTCHSFTWYVILSYVPMCHWPAYHAPYSYFLFPIHSKPPFPQTVSYILPILFPDFPFSLPISTLNLLVPISLSYFLFLFSCYPWLLPILGARFRCRFSHLRFPLLVPFPVHI